jgi:dTDP-4-dehydrorhamnose reductase
MKRILLVGKNGQVGQELDQTLQALGEVIGVDRNVMDLAQPSSIRQTVAATKPDLIVNAAAYTAVDKAEAEIDLATAVNTTAPLTLAEEADRLGAGLIHISTDYVFDGSKNTPYTEQDDPNPLSIYGQTKLAGEEGIRQTCDRHVILRTAWVYGTYGRSNFVKTMLRLGAEREELRVVADQIGAPTWARDIAQVIGQFSTHLFAAPLPSDQRSSDCSIDPGTYHFTNSGVASWYDFAIAIFEEAKDLGIPLKVEHVTPITTLEYPTPAKRPPYSVLAHQKLLTAIGNYPPHWRQSLRTMLAELHTQ